MSVQNDGSMGFPYWLVTSDCVMLLLLLTTARAW